MREKAILIISCSDSRMAVDSSVESWSRQLNFGGAIFEVRLPGGALAIADRGSHFSQSIIESYKLLSSTKQISAVILSCHEDCAYFRLKYYPSGISRSAEREAQKGFLQYAENVVAEIAPGVPVQQLYSRFKGSGDVEHVPVYQAAGPDSATHLGFDPQVVRGGRPAGHLVSTEPAPSGPPSSNEAAGARQRATSTYASERMTARQLQDDLKKRVMSGETAENSLVEALSVAEERRVVPAWRVENRLREFLELIHENSAVSTDAELQRLSLQFAARYGGARLPRQTLREVVTAAKEGVGDVISRRSGRRKAS